MLVPSKGRLEGAVAAPVVPRGCCVAGLAPAHTAAVWLSVCEAGITGRPFTRSACYLQPFSLSACSLCELSAPSFHSLPSTILCRPPLQPIRHIALPNLILCIPKSVRRSPPLPLASSIVLFTTILFLGGWGSFNSHRNTNINSSGCLCPSVELNVF